MNCDNAQKYLAALRCGFALGLQHRYECYMNYERRLFHFTEYQYVNKEVSEFWDVVLEFENSILHEEAKPLTFEDLFENIKIWYNTPA